MIESNSHKHPLLKRFLLLLVLPLITSVAFGLLFLKKGLPDVEGDIKVSGIGAQVEILRDNKGLVDIRAENDLDAFFALGFVHAQDRLWQMEFQRRLGQGRLSEIIGKSQLDVDKYMRTLGLYREAQRQITVLSSAALDILNAYTRGVNAWLERQSVLPIEYYVLGFQPEPWKPEDSLLQIQLLSLNLSGNFRRELTSSQLLKHLGSKRAHQLEGHTQEEAETLGDILSLHEMVPNLYGGLVDIDRQLSRYLRTDDPKVGSNAWVISGRHTRSGKPLLANDPHLSTQMPSRWYLAKVQGSQLAVAGGTIPGIPFVLLGHNKRIAWGGTYFPADVQDLFVEHLHPTIENKYQADDGQWLDMTLHEEEIIVASDFPALLNTPIAPIKWVARSTRNGPLISDVVPQAEMPLSISWTALQPENDASSSSKHFTSSFESFYRINYAKDLDSFKYAISYHLAPTFNFVYADTQGNIGHFAAGKVPVRLLDSGRYPKPGWDSRFRWHGVISFHDLPHTVNPASGVLVTANNKNHTDDYPYLLSTFWDPGYRATRISGLIEQQIAEGRLFDIEDLRKIQGDVANAQAQSVLPFFTALPLTHKRQRQAQNHLSSWDGVMSINSIGASIYHAWLRHFYREIIADELHVDQLFGDRKTYFDNYLDNTNPIFIDSVLAGENHIWCDDVSTSPREKCTDIAERALDEAMSELTKIAGPKMENWDWGSVHKNHYPHSLFTEVELLDNVFDRTVASGGGDFSINISPSKYDKEKGYQQYLGAGLRQVIDLSDFSRSGFITSTGQSGNVVSPHYDDMMSAYQELKLLSFATEQSQKKITLHPAHRSSIAEKAVQTKAQPRQDF